MIQWTHRLQLNTRNSTSRRDIRRSSLVMLMHDKYNPEGLLSQTRGKMNGGRGTEEIGG
uniref:Uncharacterized protein n=1 Tax=Anguilla anguilla TaxID=7936 RepID=A0A0E9RTV3_ANGAN